MHALVWAWDCHVAHSVCVVNATFIRCATHFLDMLSSPASNGVLRFRPRQLHTFTHVRPSESKWGLPGFALTSLTSRMRGVPRENWPLQLLRAAYPPRVYKFVFNPFSQQFALVRSHLPLANPTLQLPLAILARRNARVFRVAGQGGPYFLCLAQFSSTCCE